MKLRPPSRRECSLLTKKAIVYTTLGAFVATPQWASAGMTDIANSPIASASTAQVPPNILFVLDDSGSMDSEYMPDSASGWAGRIGGKAHECNTIYYNPATTYLAPKNSDGSDFANASFAGARTNGFKSTSSTTNLGSNFKPNSSTSSEGAYYYKWTGTSPPTNSDCNLDDQTGAHTATGSTGSWTKVFIGASEQTNFANWYSFYRTRLLLMKTAAGRSFQGLNDNYRVGFVTICPDPNSDCSSDGTTVKSSKYLKIDAFDVTHKAAWYTKLYEQDSNGYTPLREALSRAGRHFAGKTDGINQGMNDDPIQYSCQQNFTILTTDGYWNYGKGVQLNGTTLIGDQDNDLGISPRPMFDGGAVGQVATGTIQQERYISRSGSPNCSGTQIKANHQTRAGTYTVTTPQYGNPSTSSTSFDTPTSNPICVASGFPLSTTWTTISDTVAAPTGSAGGSTANTLADVAEYYYRTDLRSSGALNPAGVDVGTQNNVPQSGTGPEDDKAVHQHMTTFTLGLGVSGQLNFRSDYKTATTGDFTEIRSGTKGWPYTNPGSPNSATNAQEAARIDDLWHAAVNGRGQAFSATNPTSLALSLQTALSQIQVRLASAAAAATSNLEPTLTDNLVFTPKYTTSEWSGEVEAHEIGVDPTNPATYGQVLPGRVWSAQEKLDLRTSASCDGRKIKLFRKGATDNLVDFTWNTSACDASGAATGTAATDLDATEQAYFGATQVQALTQWGLMTDGTSGTVDQRTPAAGAKLVNFLRGQRANEGFAPNDANKLYRTRRHVLGDIVNAQPAYVSKPSFNFADTGYSAFKSTHANRKGMVYVAANDGMLHAFNTGTLASGYTDGGEELWSFIPRGVLPRLHKLADSNWSNLHEYFVDGAPVIGDIYDTGADVWKSIVVGGLNKGGRSYYALDITDPDNPKALWEFGYSSTCYNAGNSATWYSDCHIGYSFGNPVIGKLADGTWVVIVTSGYNNVSPTAQAGDGRGYLYVLEATTGKILKKIDTGFGDSTNPSGLSKIRAWAVGDPTIDATISRVYGVDLQGHVLRFDVNSASPTVTVLATVKDPAGNPQPITTRPELAEVGVPPSPFVYVATGKYLGTTDVSDNQTQTLYAIKDPLGASPYANLRSDLIQMSISDNGTDRFVNCVGNCNSQNGWFVDLPVSGERANIDIKLQLGTVVLTSNVPGNTACEPGGYSFKNYFHYASGQSPAGIGQSIGSRLSNALAVGFNIVRLPDGRVVVISMDSGGTPRTFEAPIATGGTSGRRITWRELIQ